MTAKAEWAIERTAKLSHRYSVKMTGGPSGFVVEWIPELPALNGLTHKEVARYKLARNNLIAEIVERRGGSILVVDV